MSVIPIQNVYYLLCYAWGHLGERDLVEASSLERMDQVHDLLGKVLAEGTFRLVRRGIDRGYRETTEELAGIRGKLEVGAMATRAVRARGRTICTYEEYSADILTNRILRSTLDLLLRSRELDADVRRDVALAHQKLDGVTILPLRRKHFRQVQLDRNQRLYRFLLPLCELAYDSVLVGQRPGDINFADFRRDEERMWRLFEEFATEFYRRELRAYRVTGQGRMGWHDLTASLERDGARIPGMVPDIVLEGPERRTILDAKYYQSPLTSHHGRARVRSGNLYQLFAYLQNRQGARPAGPRHDGILLYAAVGESFRIDVSIQGFRVQARTVDLGRPWQEVRREMLEVVEG
ncbi:MAG: hypothetical protein RJQ04_03345 [Longimicrobiales bacterium]